MTVFDSTDSAGGVSVAMCTYNGARYVEAQVRSICQQTRLPLEIVLSDDGSSDGCVQIARGAFEQCVAAIPASQAPRLRILQNSVALGVSRNFEQAISACAGEFIALCDQDDVWRVDKLERLLATLGEQPKTLLLHTDAMLVDGDRVPLGQSLFESLGVRPRELGLIREGKAIDVLLHRNLVTGATAILRRSLLDLALPIPDGWLHDEWLAIIAASVGRVDVLPEQLIEYRQHGANQVGAKRLGIAAKIQKAFAPRGEDAIRRLAKARAFLERVSVLGNGVDASVIEKARSKVTHQRCRALLPASRIKRWLPVLQEWGSGRYVKYDYGVQAVVRDLLEAP